MIIVNYKFDRKTLDKFKQLKIDVKQLKRFSNYIVNEYKATRKLWVYDLCIEGKEEYDSGYYGGHNEIDLSLKSYKRTIKTKREWVISSFFHELCHFCQDNLEYASFEKNMDYSLEDVAKGRDKYYKNPYEIQARKFEEKYTKIYLDMYYD